MVEPDYQELKAGDVPRVTKDGVTAIVIAGEALGTLSKVYTRTPTHYLHFLLEDKAVVNQPIDPEWNAFLYTLEGKVAVGPASATQVIGPHHTITLKRDGDGVTIRAHEGRASVVLISGKPLGEPVFQYGPMVMTTEEEIRQAMRDAYEHKNGFERAKGWRSEIGKPLTMRGGGMGDDGEDD
jgi:redox-sensitive bicupin YhaK (pirin superfamily)